MKDRPSSEAGFAISTAAEIVGTNIQNLRVYERHGLVTPARSPGGTRSYSAADIEVLNEVTALLGDGLNLTGVSRVMLLTAQVRRLEAELKELRSQS